MENNKGNQVQKTSSHKSKHGGQAIKFPYSEKPQGIFSHLLAAGSWVVHPGCCGRSRAGCSLVKVDTLWLFPSLTSQEIGVFIFFSGEGCGWSSQIKN